MKFVLFLFLRFSSGKCFILGSTHCKRTSMMEFTLEKLKNLIAQMQFCYLRTSLQMEHVPKTSCLEKHILTKMSMVYHGFNNRVAILPKRELALDLAEKPP